MEERNQSSAKVFIFLGLTDDSNLQIPLFLLFLILYIFTIASNVGISVLIMMVSQLHSPMYFFLCTLSMSDFCYISVIIPRMLKDLLSDNKSVSFIGCAAQTFFVVFFSSCGCYLLTAMAYDRYAAICHPLLYPVIINRSLCILLVNVACLLGIITGVALTGCVFHASFCGSNVIDHFYCDVPTMMGLSCYHARVREIALLTVSFFVGVGSLSITVASYIYIILAIVKIPSNTGRIKTFSTCGSHLTVLLMFYITALFCYLSFPKSGQLTMSKIMSVCYTIGVPMVNPLIYSVRNQEVKGVMLAVIRKKLH